MPQTKEQRNQKQRERYAKQKNKMQKADEHLILHMNKLKSRILDTIEILKEGKSDNEEKQEELKKILIGLNAQDYINKNNCFNWKDKHQKKKEEETEQEIIKVNKKIEQLREHFEELKQKLIYNYKLLDEYE